MKKIYLLYLCIELALFLTFIIIDFTSSSSSEIFKYISICLTLFLSALFFQKDEKYFDYLTGLTLIVIADYFLLLKESEKEICIGITFFIFAHLFHQKLFYKRNYILYLSIVTFFLILQNDLVTSLGACYAIALLFNLGASLINYLKSQDKRYLLYLISYVFLIFCDLCVLYNFNNNGLAEWMWVFYLPFFVLHNFAALDPFSIFKKK